MADMNRRHGRLDRTCDDRNSKVYCTFDRIAIWEMRRDVVLVSFCRRIIERCSFDKANIRPSDTDPCSDVDRSSTDDCKACRMTKADRNIFWRKERNFRNDIWPWPSWDTADMDPDDIIRDINDRIEFRRCSTFYPSYRCYQRPQMNSPSLWHWWLPFVPCIVVRYRGQRILCSSTTEMSSDSMMLV